MRLFEMIETLYPDMNERIEIRDSENNELFTCPIYSDGLEPYMECEVVRWFPHGVPGKDATFTVSVYIENKDSEVHDD